MPWYQNINNERLTSTYCNLFAWQVRMP